MTNFLRHLLAPPRAASGPKSALFEKGFRPFFLLGALFATCAVPLWLVALRGGISPGGAFGPMQWHAHEMLFGFSTAIIAGFLLTAVGNWTSRETVTGAPLAGLAALWLLGRFAMFFAGRLPQWAPALVD
ncbi:MAG: NnrS family protein, partial [Polyangiaceae bacterium]